MAGSQVCNPSIAASTHFISLRDVTWPYCLVRPLSNFSLVHCFTSHSLVFWMWMLKQFIDKTGTYCWQKNKEMKNQIDICSWPFLDTWRVGQYPVHHHAHPVRPVQRSIHPHPRSVHTHLRAIQLHPPSVHPHPYRTLKTHGHRAALSYLYTGHCIEKKKEQQLFIETFAQLLVSTDLLL